MLKLAVPMTLNNLAGGIATGITGVSPFVAAAAALCASFSMMAAGYWLGKACAAHMKRCIDPRLLSAIVFTLVALMQIASVVQDALGGEPDDGGDARA